MFILYIITSTCTFFYMSVLLAINNNNYIIIIITINCECMYVFVCLSSSEVTAHPQFISLCFVFLTLFVSHHKPCLLPDRSVAPVVVHYASGQSYFSSAVTPILMNLSEGRDDEPEQRQKEPEKENSQGRRRKNRRKQTSRDRE